MRPDNTALAETLQTTNPRSTIRPGSLDATIASDPPVTGFELETLDARFVLGTTIGEGGMAVVRLAKQSSLGRDVAVKVLRADATREAEPRLLREAWITGALEHPNIVPVHDLGADDGGRPMLVLKRIEGKPWSELIHDGAEIRRRFGMDPTEWNLRQFVHVCHAIAFAHDRGIIHRDLKPANIMIGGFGEVYVLDWGIALSLVDDGSGRLPLASKCTELAGTLAYMAPEMLGDKPLTTRTDVYLLGAILHDIVTGSPPHLRESIAATIESIDVSRPTFSADLPEELVAICRRAMARDPAERHATADELRAEIVGYLEHRGSAEIAREALQRLRELEAHMRSVPDRVTAYQLFGESKFGFQAALRAWPGNATAREALDRALTSMASWELDQGDARAAAVLAAELSKPDAELAARLAAAERAAEEKTRRLAKIEADQDAASGSLARGVFLVLFGVAWSAMPALAYYFPIVEIDHPTSLIVTAVSLAFITTFGFIARETMRKTAINRGVLLTVFLALVLHGIVEAGAWALGLDMVTTHMVSIALWAGAAGVAAIFLDRAIVFPTLAFLVALVATVVSPERRFWAISASCTVLLTTVIYIWYRSRRGRPIYGLADMLRPAL